MRWFRVDLVREDRAIVVIESEVPVQGSLVREDFPMRRPGLRVVHPRHFG
jgi:hypothetical protein